MSQWRGMRRVLRRMAARAARQEARDAGVANTSQSGDVPAMGEGHDSRPPSPPAHNKAPPASVNSAQAEPVRSAEAVPPARAAPRRRVPVRGRMGPQPGRAAAPGATSARGMPAPPTAGPEPAAGSSSGLREAFGRHNLERAWLQIKRNGGGPGVDGVTLAQFERERQPQLDQLRREVLTQTYRPMEVKNVWVPKRSGEGQRPLALWAIRDRVAQRAVVDYLEPHFEQRFLDCSFGFRPGRGVQDAVARVVTLRDQGLRWVVDADIKECFDSIDPALLKLRLRAELHDGGLLWLLQSWIDAHIMNALAGRRPTAGTSQGGPISPLLANVYLHPLDERLTASGLQLVRYADDLVILCRRRQEAEAAHSLLQGTLNDLRLSLNVHKTRLVQFDEGFQFLGYFFLRGEHHYLGF